MIPVDVKDGAGGIADDLQVRAVVVDDRLDDAVAQMDDERRPRLEGGDLAEEVPEGLVAVGDRIADDDEPQILSILPGRDRPQSFVVGRDDAPELLGDGAKLRIFPEPGQVIPPVFEGVGASAREKGQDQRHI
jgi:hypothetical protein